MGRSYNFSYNFIIYFIIYSMLLIVYQSNVIYQHGHYHIQNCQRASHSRSHSQHPSFRLLRNNFFKLVQYFVVHWIEKDESGPG
jgi:hypothetical protein